MEEGRKFYATLYKDEEDVLLPIDEVHEILMGLDIPQVSEEDRAFLDQPFCEKELQEALSQLNSNKAPGSDGLPPEFYVRFWHQIAPYYLASLDHSILTGRLSNSQRRGIITLVPKKDVDRRHIANWRPITLLNTDYKIYTKALAVRMRRVMGQLIHPNQTGFLQGRLIGDSIRAAEDALERIKYHHQQGMLVALDFAKAFDSVRWSFIFQTLEAFGFGESFIEYVKILFIDVQSCLYNSRFTSASFNPRRGVRQGCCVSPSLFLLVAEILAIAVRGRGDIKGVQFRGVETKLSQFADDTTCFLADHTSLEHLLEVLFSFSTWSGLKVNKSKTKIISPSLLNENEVNLEGMPVVGKAKILGIWMGVQNNQENSYIWNFHPQLQKIAAICESWTHRSLSLKGKVTVANALLISLLQYPSSVTFTPPRVAKEYRQIVSSFL